MINKACCTHTHKSQQVPFGIYHGPFFFLVVAFVKVWTSLYSSNLVLSHAGMPPARWRTWKWYKNWALLGVLELAWTRPPFREVFGCENADSWCLDQKGGFEPTLDAQGKTVKKWFVFSWRDRVNYQLIFFISNYQLTRRNTKISKHISRYPRAIPFFAKPILVFFFWLAPITLNRSVWGVNLDLIWFHQFWMRQSIQICLAEDVENTLIFFKLLATWIFYFSRAKRWLKNPSRFSIENGWSLNSENQPKIFTGKKNKQHQFKGRNRPSRKPPSFLPSLRGRKT